MGLLASPETICIAAGAAAVVALVPRSNTTGRHLAGCRPAGGACASARLAGTAAAADPAPAPARHCPRGPCASSTTEWQDAALSEGFEEQFKGTSVPKLPPSELMARRHMFPHQVPTLSRRKLGMDVVVGGRCTSEPPKYKFSGGDCMMFNQSEEWAEAREAAPTEL